MIGDSRFRVFEHKSAAAEALALDWLTHVGANADASRPYYIALSGGSTPALFYRQAASSDLSRKVRWENIHIFWGDERCVGPEHPDSNFGMANRELLTKIRIPEINIHRIRGESNPEDEAVRYENEAKKVISSTDNGVPRFDLILLGVGNDGHTASLFPGDKNLEVQSSIYRVTIHPETGRKRITMTLNTINNSKQVRFLVSGKEKADVVADIIKKNTGFLKYPAAKVEPFSDDLLYYLDRDAASGI